VKRGKEAKRQSGKGLIIIFGTCNCDYYQVALEMNEKYSDTLRYLYEQLPYFQRKGAVAYKNNLDNTLALDELYGHPHHKFKSVHVAGTNGKGSVSHMLASIFQEAGYKTGLYTSPHLKDFRERIRVNGKKIPKDTVFRFIKDFRVRNKEQKISPSFFELTVTMAFDFFEKEKVDIAIVEVGLGGRLDSTNIITPELSVITNISIDHAGLLGNTIEKIAVEKAGIIKERIPVVIGESDSLTSQIFNNKASELDSSVCFADKMYEVGTPFLSLAGLQNFFVREKGNVIFENLALDLPGNYQGKNLCTALAVISELKNGGWEISENEIRSGLENVVRNTGMLGRWQIIGANPRIVCDTGHNVAGIREVVAQIRQTPWKKLHFVLGVVNDKEIDAILELLPKEAEYYFTKANIPRALDEKTLEKEARLIGLKGKIYPSVKTAFEAAKANASSNDMIFIGGSTFVVAEAI
jgi:dihydrofolate synthase/folylpolyglutamate synthase